jgi:hypothetical protein
MHASVSGLTPCDKSKADMSGRSPGVKGVPGPPPGGSRCLFILQRCLAIQLQKVALLSEQRKSVRDHEEPEYWMYDSGYLLFQVRRFMNWKWSRPNRDTIRGYGGTGDKQETAQGSRYPECPILICISCGTNSMEQSFFRSSASQITSRLSSDTGVHYRFTRVRQSSYSKPAESSPHLTCSRPVLI